jgi:Holliday junction resolvase
MARLRERGWAVTRAAGSHGPADLWAVEPALLPLPPGGEMPAGANELAWVQCKLGGPGALRPAEWNALFDEALRFGAVPLIAHRPRRGRLEFLRLLARKPDTGVRGPAAPCEPWEPSFW